MVKALTGIKVIDLSRVVAGPFCCSILGDLGADVIKVEGPDTLDETRTWFPPDVENISLYFMAANRNKRAMTINLKTKEGIEIVKKLLTDADVLVENFKTGTMERLGLSYSELKELNPRLIYCSITGFGQTGPYKHLPGYDYLAQAMGGFMSINGFEDSDPVKAGVAIADMYSGLYAVISILASLQARTHTERGQHCDIALLDSMVASLLNLATGYLNTGKLPKRFGNQHPTVVPYQNFHTLDGQIIIAVGNDSQFRRLCDLLGLEDIRDDSRFASASNRIHYRNELIPVLQRELLSKTAKQWIDLFQANNIPCGPINTLDQVFIDPQVIERNMIQEVHHPIAGMVKLIGSPLKLSETPPSIDRYPPLPGEHTTEILEQLGYSESDIDLFYQQKII